MKRVKNPHKGGHFTPEMNRVWAAALYELLRFGGDNVMPRRSKAKPGRSVSE